MVSLAFSYIKNVSANQDSTGSIVIVCCRFLPNRATTAARQRHLPVSTVNLVARMRDFPFAKNVCVWWRVAYGITVRDEWFSKSAEIAIDSPENHVTRARYRLA